MRLSGNTDCHTSDIGHWFATTSLGFCRIAGFVVCACPLCHCDPYVETPTPATAGNNHPLKGGSFQRGPWRHRAAFQLGWDRTAGQDRGIRVAITLP